MCYQSHSLSCQFAKDTIVIILMFSYTNIHVVKLVFIRGFGWVSYMDFLFKSWYL